MSHDPSNPPFGNPHSTYPPRPRGAGVLGCLFGMSMLFNAIAAAVIVLGCFGMSFFSKATIEADGPTVVEKFHSGTRTASDKIAIVHLDGTIMEGFLDFVHKEIDRAAQDNSVKAVVLRINSPGGSITASDDLHRRLVLLRDGNPAKKTPAKPLVVSMGSLAASGGYYVAMPAKPILAERTSMTGSIGVYASFPNVSGLSKDWKIGMEIIKQGEIKDSGSPFKEMNAKEKQVWQDLVDTAYNQFLAVVEAGRPNLKGKMLEPIAIKPVRAGPPGKEPPADYRRYRADGGIFTADKALEFGLIDGIGTLDDAIQEAKKSANVGEDFKAIDYERPRTLFSLLGVKAPDKNIFEPGRLRNALIPRLWYLAPGCELSGLLAAIEKE